MRKKRRGKNGLKKACLVEEAFKSDKLIKIFLYICGFLPAHVVNNAYGFQSSKSCHNLNQVN